MPARCTRWWFALALTLGLGCRAAGAETGVPAPPEDPTSAKVYAVFDRVCAECHQAGRTKAPIPGGAFGHVLDLPTLARDATKVLPANPDGSRLYMLMQSRLPPHDVALSGQDIDLPASDLDAVRDWIQTLPPAPGCTDRQRITNEEVAAEIAQLIDAAGPATAPHLRFLTLAHAYNACATEPEIAASRTAATVTVNSLSWGLRPVALGASGAGGLILPIDLRAIGWSSERWRRLVQAYPYAGQMPSLPDAERQAATSILSVRADWFVATALQPALYYDLLGLPDRLSSLLTSLRIDLPADLAESRARRIGLRTSTVTHGSRLLQRHPFANGAFWLTYEYAPTPGRPDLFDAPGGPGSRGAPKADASVAMFTLPNGYHAFFMTNGDGLRLTDAPSSILRHDAFPSRRLAVGADCFACHQDGVRGATDEMRARVQGDTTIPRDIRDRTLALHVSAEEMQRLLDEDRRRLTEAAAGADVAVGATLRGVPAVSALVARYQGAVTLEALAAELGTSPVAIRAAAARADKPVAEVLQRIVHGPVPRALVEAMFQPLLAALGLARGTPAAPTEGVVTEPFTLVLKTGGTTFKAGDLFSVTARVNEACYLTLINVDQTGRGTVIYPNDFEPNNHLEAGRELRVPADGAPYQFRLREPGRETVVGICQVSSRTPSGIRHDFERQRFTELGDYRAFLNRTVTNEPAARAAAQAPKEPRSNRRQRRVAEPAPPPARGEGQARAAVQVIVQP